MKIVGTVSVLKRSPQTYGNYAIHFLKIICLMESDLHDILFRVTSTDVLNAEKLSKLF